jgi:hypothetical protein
MLSTKSPSCLGSRAASQAMLNKVKAPVIARPAARRGLALKAALGSTAGVSPEVRTLEV